MGLLAVLRWGLWCEAFVHFPVRAEGFNFLFEIFGAFELFVDRCEAEICNFVEVAEWL